MQGIFLKRFNHLPTGPNFDINAGISDDKTEDEIHLRILQGEYDKKDEAQTNEQILPGYADPDTLNAFE